MNKIKEGVSNFLKRVHKGYLNLDGKIDELSNVFDGK